MNKMNFLFKRQRLHERSFPVIRYLIAITLIVGFALPAKAETLILWSKKAKACGTYGYTYRAGYTIEAFTSSAATTRSGQVSKRITELKAENAAGVHIETLNPGQCIAVAQMDKKVGTCEFRTFSWKIAPSATAAQAAMERVLAGEPNLKGSAIQEVRCAKPPEKKDTAWGIRG
ncbi:hypothetical protein [Aquidulcibacter paucihalophilus]|uniref:hypothetical protein n=1 Tax=Aquidulcibacter paucihalophilus TaxID=1978549 RepID=UPI0012FFC794|nr:hypothetical protein [Aquidulcibacter paucihalophilus]